MTTENSNAITSAEQAAFKTEFFGGTPTPVEAPVESHDADADDTSSEDDALDTNVQPDAEADPDDNDGDDTEAVVEKPKKKTAQERISEITAKLRLAEQREAEALRKLQERETPEPKVDVKPVLNEVGAPTPDDKNEDGTDKYPLGEFDEQLARDRAEFFVQKQWDTLQAKEAEKTALQTRQTELQRTATEWETKLAEVEKDLPDIRQSVDDLKETFESMPEEVGEHFAMVLMSMDKGPQVVDYLAENPEELHALVASGLTKATIGLGRIEARFMAEDGSKIKPKVTKAPEPPRTVNRGNHGQFSSAPDTDDLAAFKRDHWK